MEALSRMISHLAINPDVICSYRVENLHARVICFLLHVLLQSLTPHLLGKDTEEVVVKRKMEASYFNLWKIILRIMF